jgi:hypothetical protein
MSEEHIALSLHRPSLIAAIEANNACGQKTSGGEEVVIEG